MESGRRRGRPRRPPTPPDVLAYPAVSPNGGNWHISGRIGAGRGASKGPFPDALPRTRRAALTATGSPDASFPPRALLAWSSSALDFIAQTHRLHGACDYLSTDRMLIILPPFAMCTAFPYSDYYGGSDAHSLRRGLLAPAMGLPRSRPWTLHCDVGGGYPNNPTALCGSPNGDRQQMPAHPLLG